MIAINLESLENEATSKSETNRQTESVKRRSNRNEWNLKNWLFCFKNFTQADINLIIKRENDIIILIKENLNIIMIMLINLFK
jgi:hypothetical protein